MAQLFLSSALPELGKVVGKTDLEHFQCGSLQEFGAHPFFGELGRDISSQVRVFPVGYLEFRMEFTPKGSLFKVP